MIVSGQQKQQLIQYVGLQKLYYTFNKSNCQVPRNKSHQQSQLSKKKKSLFTACFASKGIASFLIPRNCVQYYEKFTLILRYSYTNP